MAANPIPSLSKAPKFDPSCFWYQKLKDDTPSHPQSAEFMQEFHSQLQSENGGIAAINADQWTAPVYITCPGDPRIAVIVNPGGVPAEDYDCLVQQFKSVPIPDYAKPSPEVGPYPDNQMAIYDPSSDILWEFYQAVNHKGAWQIGAGGRMTNVSQNKNGFFPYPFGSTATCLPQVGGQISVEDLQAGLIGHVMGIALKACDPRIWSLPAQKTDGTGEPTDLCIPEGLRFRLPAGTYEGLKLRPVAMTIAKAAEDFGFVIWDQAGTISLRCTNLYSYTLPPRGSNPYPALFDPINQGITQFNVLADFPWDKIEFLPFNYPNV
jgi:hypothetical protein